MTSPAASHRIPPRRVPLPAYGSERYWREQQRAALQQQQEDEARRQAEEDEMHRAEIAKAERRIYNGSLNTLPPRARCIVREVCAEHGVSPAELLSRSRRYIHSHARQHAMWRVHTELGWGVAEIGRRFGRDHTTALHGCRAHERRMAEARS